jgi:nucleoside-diphosphate-sugar epimerase
VARILIVGCGCRGSSLAGALRERGHRARGTTRRTERLIELESLGIEPRHADPDRLATLTPLFEGVAALCWLMGSAIGPPEAVSGLHRERLRSLLDALVDTHVRGFVYERAGTVAAASLATGEEIARSAERRNRIRLAMIEAPPDDQELWLVSAVRAVDDVLAA